MRKTNGSALTNPFEARDTSNQQQESHFSLEILETISSDLWAGEERDEKKILQISASSSSRHKQEEFLDKCSAYKLNFMPHYNCSPVALAAIAKEEISAWTN